FYTFGQPSLGAFVQHGHDGPDYFQVTELFSSNVEQHILAARIVLAQSLRKVPTSRGQLALRAAKLFKHQICEAWVGFAYAYCVLQSLIVDKHRVLLGFSFE